eukprot:3420588-Amphidinium_carterae.1
MMLASQQQQQGTQPCYPQTSSCSTINDSCKSMQYLKASNHNPVYVQKRSFCNGSMMLRSRTSARKADVSCVTNSHVVTRPRDRCSQLPWSSCPGCPAGRFWRGSQI